MYCLADFYTDQSLFATRWKSCGKECFLPMYSRRCCGFWDSVLQNSVMTSVVFLSLSVCPLCCSLDILSFCALWDGCDVVKTRTSSTTNHVYQVNSHLNPFRFDGHIESCRYMLCCVHGAAAVISQWGICVKKQQTHAKIKFDLLVQPL